MITINLLPETYRKSKASSIQQFHRSPLALMVLGGFVGLAVLLAGWRGANQLRLAHLTGRIAALASKKRAVDELKSSIALLQQRQQALEEADRQRSRWAARLNAISDLTPMGVWFTDLLLDQDQLVLQGAAMSQHGEEMAAVNRFVQELKTDPRTAQVIQEVRLESIHNVQDGEIELMKFTVTCRLK